MLGLLPSGRSTRQWRRCVADLTAIPLAAAAEAIGAMTQPYEIALGVPPAGSTNAAHAFALRERARHCFE